MPHFASPGGIPRIDVRGTAYECGLQYGMKARRRVQVSLETYRALFSYHAGWDWPQAVNYARGFLPAIDNFAPQVLEEMRGIADGAKVHLDDILAINVRSEIMFAGARLNARSADALPDECSAFAALPAVTLDRHTLIGQNWDWMPSAYTAAVMLAVHREGAPSFLTIVEAGLLAKTGTNASGLAVCTNTLVSQLDSAGGVPYHVILRCLMDCESISDAVSMVLSVEKALPANYLLGQADGLAIDLETTSGCGLSSAARFMPEEGQLSHTNHFLDPVLATSDRRVLARPNTLFRLESLRSSMQREVPAITVETLKGMLADHRNQPGSVCMHPDVRLPELERTATIASVIYDLGQRTAYVCAGNPCRSPYEKYDCGPDFSFGSGEAERDRRSTSEPEGLHASNPAGETPDWRVTR